MNAAYARFGGDLLGKPYLAVPYLSQGYGEKASRLITLALGGGSPAEEPADRLIIDSWAQELGIPGEDAGIDFAREYELAKGMAGGGVEP